MNRMSIIALLAIGLSILLNNAYGQYGPTNTINGSLITAEPQRIDEMSATEIEQVFKVNASEVFEGDELNVDKLVEKISKGGLFSGMEINPSTGIMKLEIDKDRVE